MNKIGLLPKMAVSGIKKNGSAYIPYMMITSFSVFVFFIFSAICDNEIMNTLPHAMYVLVLMQIGRVLLGIILAPVLFSTNKFLVKQRSSELGLYNILGLDRKYIAVIMAIETAVIYIATIFFGILTATVFSKMIYLFLINLAQLDVTTEFTASSGSYGITILYFGILFIFNLLVNLWEVFKAKPIEMMKKSKKGEKQVRFLGLKSVTGVLVLAAGYGTALLSAMDSTIFVTFFLAVLLVVLGTRILFKSGTISVLSIMKRRPHIYYKKNHFIMISDMLYRMKRTAQSLANISIFSTMVMITLICTVSLLFGQDAAIRFNYPLDAVYNFDKTVFNEEAELKNKINELAQEYRVTVTDEMGVTLQELNLLKKRDVFTENTTGDFYAANAYQLILMSLRDYNKIEGKNITLAADEVLVFGNSKDYGYETLTLQDRTYQVKEELKSLRFERKEEKNMVNEDYYIILPEEEQIAYWAGLLRGDEDDCYYSERFNLQGTKADKEAFISALNAWGTSQEGYLRGKYIGEWEKETKSMFGGLVFLGIFFGIIFSVCLVLMMYYKQISEGFEDRRNFRILKQVGMSEDEIRKTIRKQILGVFFLPLAVSIMHTFIGLHMVKGMLTAIYLFNGQLILGCSIMVMTFFAVLYSFSYIMTSRAYYKIVK